MTEPGLDIWLSFLGRLHPLLLHVPIGALVLLAGAELWTRRQSARPLEPGTRAFLCGVTALFALASASTGWLLGDAFESGGTTFERHRFLGIAFAVSVTLAALCAAADRRRAYGALLAIGLVLLVPVGHLGAEMTHGSGFLVEPFEEHGAAGEPDEGGASPGEYEAVIAPILSARCTRCHGQEKRKGGLALHEPSGLSSGGDSGLSPVTPGDPGASEILRRLRLPADDEDHMPPPSKPQPTAEEIATIERWIAAGASFEAPRSTKAVVFDPEPEEAPPLEESRPSREAPPPEAVAALRAATVHVEVVDPADGSLWIGFRARPSSTDDFVREHLTPLAPFVVELDLARTAVSDALLPFLADLVELERLDLSRTACSSAGIVALRSHPALRSLNLTGTPIEDAALDALAELPQLERLYVSETSVSADGLASLAARAPGLAIAGDALAPSRPLEVEPPVLLGGETDLRPVNATCPVSGQPVDPAFRVVHDERVIGFCCGDCPTRFWESPDEFSVEAR